MAREKLERSEISEFEISNQSSAKKPVYEKLTLSAFVANLRKSRKIPQIISDSSSSTTEVFPKKPSEYQTVGFFKLTPNTPSAYITSEEVDTIDIDYRHQIILIMWQDQHDVWRRANFKAQHPFTPQMNENDIVFDDEKNNKILFQGAPLKTDDSRMISCEILPNGPERWQLQ
ncbi:MAG: hypothetical protein P4L65_06880 [Legionella sp.]|nr:hypothetical protein [Legionella sp.]